MLNVGQVTNSLEATEGVSNGKVHISEGAATGGLTKHTNFRAA